MTDLIYAAAYPIYRDRGWPSLIKLRAGTKWPPPAGFTGRDGVDPSGADCHAWAEEEPDGNNAIRVDERTIGIDTDAYDNETGAATLAEAEKRWGKLPYSPRSTSRDDGISGIRLYRIPPGVELLDRIEFPELGIGDIEIIQHHHRYVMCWPSIHPSGRQYQWLGIDGGPLDEPPAPDDIPDLPAAWLDGLRKPEHNHADLGDGPYDVRQALTEGEMSRRVARKLGESVLACHGPSRHDHTRDNVLALLRYGKQCDTGVLPALKALQKAFVAAVGPDRPGGAAQAAEEFRDFVNSDRVAQLLAQPDHDDWTHNLGEPPPDTDDHHTGEWTGQPPADDTDDTKAQTPVYADRILTRSALRNLPNPEPLIDNVLDQGTTALLYGKWGTAKTFIALDWAASVATRRNWQDRPTTQRRVLYVVGEAAFGFKGRIDAWEQGWHTDINDGELDILPFAVNLTNTSDVNNLAALIDWGGYSFIILDTLARCMVGADENSAKDCGLVVDAIAKLLACTPAGRGVLLGVHHAGKDGKTLRGSSAFEGAADTVYFASRDGAVISLDREKRKDGPEGDRHELRLGLIEGTGSCVVELHLGTATSSRAKHLSCTYDTYFATTGATGAALRDVSGLEKHTFYRALSDLLKDGYLVNIGTDKRPFYKKPGGQ
jgi:hypothetical protein